MNMRMTPLLFKRDCGWQHSSVRMMRTRLTELGRPSGALERAARRGNQEC